MIIHYPGYYKKFRCLAGECPDTCCIGWEITVDRETEKTYQKLRKGKSELAERLRRSVRRRLIIPDGDRCPFLAGDGLCDLCREYGEAAMTRTCRRYPRHVEDFGDIHEVELLCSCPEAARLILSENFRLITRNMPERKGNTDGIDEERLALWFSVRGQVFAMAGDRRMPLWARMRRILAFCHDVQARLRREDTAGVEALVERAEGEKFILKMTGQKGGEAFYKEVAKEAFIENYVFYRSRASAYIFTGENATVLTESENVLSALDEETAYIRLTQFNGQAAQEFAAVMDIFKEEKKKNLILDLRSNGGGYLNILQDIAGYFCKGATDGTPLVAIADYPDNQRSEFEATANKYAQYFAPDSRISVLADNGTASASECLIGCMMDYGAISYSDIYLSSRSGETKTYGKGIMQRTFASSLFGKPDAIKLTTARILWPLTENCIHGRGVLPEDGAHTVAENYDGDAEILEAWNSISAAK